jgi:hypothetical protein
MIQFVVAIQGLYFLLIGMWPLISIDTFQRVTGRKTDLWLVKTVGVTITVIGFVLLSAALRGKIAFDVMLLATGSVAILTAIDVVYVIRRIISPVYLLDALLEIILARLRRVHGHDCCPGSVGSTDWTRSKRSQEWAVDARATLINHITKEVDNARH